MQRFKGKVAVVTGASGGIGAAMAKRFAEEGAAVVVSAIDPRVDDVAAAAEEGRRAGRLHAHGRHQEVERLSPL